MASIIKNMRTICNKDDSPYLPIINDFSKELIIEKINDRINEKIKSFYDFYSNLKYYKFLNSSKREIKETLNKEIKRQENNKRESKKNSPSSSENSSKSDDFKNQKHKKKLS